MGNGWSAGAGILGSLPAMPPSSVIIAGVSIGPRTVIFLAYEKLASI